MHAEKLPTYLVQFVQVGGAGPGIGHQQGGDVGSQLAARGEVLVHRQHAQRMVVHIGPRQLVGQRVHPAGDAQLLVMVKGHAPRAQQGGMGQRGQQVGHRVVAGIGEETVWCSVRVLADGVACLGRQGSDGVGIDCGALEHGLVGPAGVHVVGGEQDRLLGPFAVVEALFQRRNVIPVGARYTTDDKELAAHGLAVAAPLAQAPFQFVQGNLLAGEVGQHQLQATLYGMRVGVEHARHQHLAAQVDDPGAFGLQA
ncbi:hypothetical protein D3C76_467530 [compost metagenome]